jgi:hypothetical protein
LGARLYWASINRSMRRKQPACWSLVHEQL